MAKSAEHIVTFWSEYVHTARRHHIAGMAVNAVDDPMLAAFHDWFRKIDKAIAKAEAEHFPYFEARLVDRYTRIALRFRNVDGKIFARTLPISATIMRNGRTFTTSDIIDLKIALQTMIIYEGRIKGDPKAAYMPGFGPPP